MKTEINQIDWKNRIGIAVLNGGIFMLVFGLVHYIWNGELYEWKRMVFQGVFFGLFMAIAFPYIFGKFAKNLGKNIYPDLEENEEVETEGPANLFRGMEAVGGKLFMTNKKLIFKSHKLNIQTGQTDVSYQLISEIQSIKIGKLADNGLRIKTVENGEFDLVLTDRATWIQKINYKRISVS